MKYLQTKAHKLFKVVLQWELLRITLKYIYKNLYLPFWVRYYAIMSLITLPISSSLSFLHSRCFISGKARSVINFIKLNRMQFKVAISKNQLTGIRKNSW